MKADDVGTYWTTNGEDIWQLIVFCEHPTATMLNLKTQERIGGAIDSLNLQPFVKLRPEKPMPAPSSK